MKKLIWTLSALALTGLCFSACDDDEEAITKEFCESIGKVYVEVEGVASCADAQPGVKDCHVDASLCSGSTPYCVQVPNGNYLCSGTEQCASGLIRDNDGYCVSDVIVKNCTSHDGCEPGYLCGKNNECVPEAEAADVYRYVRIDDLSVPTNSQEDPGADIDAVILWKPNGDHYTAGVVTAYHYMPDFFKEGSVANDSSKITGEPDAFTTYTNGGLGAKEGSCDYRKGGSLSGDFTFVSLGGMKEDGSDAGYIEVEMTGAIENNDRLDILELGGCKTKGTKDDNTGEAKEFNAKSEDIRVQLSITKNATSWTAVKEFKSRDDKGLLNWVVSGL